MNRTLGFVAIALITGLLAAAPFAAAGDTPAPGPGAAEEQAAAKLPAWDFEDGSLPACFSASGHDAKLEVVEGQGPAGRMSLRWTWQARRDQLAALRVALDGLPESAAGLEMWLRASAPTSFVLLLSERTGARYQGFFRVDAGRWYRISLPLSELWLAENCTDTDGRLTLGEVSSLTLLDIANLPGSLGLALGLKDGPQQVDIEGIRFLARAPEGHSQITDGMALIDCFSSGPLWLLPIGGPKLRVQQPEQPPEGCRGNELVIEYTADRYRWCGYVAGIGHLPVERLEGVRLWARADPPVRIAVVLEERDGSKYEASVRVMKAVRWQRIRLPLERFVKSRGAKDENGKLDPDQLRVIIIVADAFSADLSRTDGVGRVWICAPTLVLKGSEDEGGAGRDVE